MNAYALTTVDRLKAFLGITVATYDSVLEVIINATTDYVENECDRRFKETVYSGYVFDGSSGNQIVLPQWPVKSGATFVLYERASSNYGDNAWHAINSDRYRVDEQGGIVTLNSPFYHGFQNYKVDFTAGYAFENASGALIPLSSAGLSDLELVVWKLASDSYNHRKGSGDISSFRLYNYAVNYSKDSTAEDDIKKTLGKYTRLNF